MAYLYPKQKTLNIIPAERQYVIFFPAKVAISQLGSCS